MMYLLSFLLDKSIACNYNVIIMELTITRIGNSRGIRIPKAILKQCGFTDTAQVVIKNSQLILSPSKVRVGWNEQFAKLNTADSEVITDMNNEWDEDEWQW